MIQTTPLSPFREELKIFAAANALFGTILVLHGYPERLRRAQKSTTKWGAETFDARDLNTGFVLACS